MRILIIAIALSLTLPAWAQDCALQLAGHVTDADTKLHLAGATVLVVESGEQITTDSAGDFLFTRLCPGNLTIQVSHVSCETIRHKLNLTKSLHIDVMLPHDRKTLGDVVVESRKGIPNTGFKKEITGADLEKTRGQSLAEALSALTGVTLLQTGSSISKPVIHGLHSNRILTINNGVRQEGQQWGNEHAPEIDPFIAEKLVVIKGVDELKYGSDAIGGVILVEPKALRTTAGHTAEVTAGYFTNNRQYVVSGIFEQQLPKWPSFRYRVQGTFKKGANATTPGYRLNNTGSEESNFSVTAGYTRGRSNTELFYSQFNTRVGIFTGSHIGNLTDLEAAIASNKPSEEFLGEQTYRIQRPYQKVQHHLLKLKSGFYKGGHKFNVLLAGQFNHRKEYDLVRSASNTAPQLDLSIFTLTQDLSWEHPRTNNFSGIAGISMMQQDNSYGGRYFIPNYLAYSFGGYWIEKWHRHHWELQAGVRYDNKTINTSRLKFNNDTINYDFNFATLGSSFNAIYKPNNHWEINAGINLATRAPYVNELLSDGIHHGTATYEKGNIYLRPERSLNVSAGIKYSNEPGTWKVDVLLYSNQIKDFIYQQPRPGSPVLTISGAFPLIEYSQTNALLSGFDAGNTLKLGSQLELSTRLSVLYARTTKTNDWLIMMPANRLTNELTYQLPDAPKRKATYASLEWTAVARQTRVPDDANGKQDYKAPPPGYSLVALHLSSTLAINQVPVTFSISARNLLNQRYRDYLNSFRYFTDEMGRNINLRIKIPLFQKIDKTTL